MSATVNAAEPVIHVQGEFPVPIPRGSAPRQPRHVPVWAVAVAAAAGMAVGGALLHPLVAALPASSPTHTVVFEVGGQVSSAHNSAGATWGQPVQLASATSYVVASKGGVVSCRILVDGTVVAEGHGAVADCGWTDGADPVSCQIRIAGTVVSEGRGRTVDCGWTDTTIKSE